MRDVLIVRAPGEPREALEELRDYVVESLRRGVLVVPEGMELEVLALPEPGEEDAGPDAPEEPSAAPTGRGAEEKRAIQEKLKAYRRAHGLWVLPGGGPGGAAGGHRNHAPQHGRRYGGLSPQRLARCRARPGSSVQVGHRGGKPE